MMLNTNYNNIKKMKSKKKKYNFSMLICPKSRMKFKITKDELLMSLNNSMSMTLEKRKSINMEINDSKLSLFSDNLEQLNMLTKNMLPFSSPSSFL